MELRTEMKAWSDGRTWPTVKDGRYVYGPLEHDAAAAHALVRAMKEIEGTYADCSTAEDVRNFLHERAAELMREWGFTEQAGGE